MIIYTKKKNEKGKSLTIMLIQIWESKLILENRQYVKL